MKYRNAAHAWESLDAKRTTLRLRWERYAALTLPRLLYPDGMDEYNSNASRGYQSIGGQLSTHLSNKLVMAMFAPSRPFFRGGLAGTQLAKAQAAGFDETALTKTFSAMERKATAQLDTRGQRSKLYSIMQHLVVIGNALMWREDEQLRVQSTRYYCVKRDLYGRVQTLVVREKVMRDELPAEVLATLPALQPGEDNRLVSYYRWVTREPNGFYKMTQWVDNTQLNPAKFDGRWAPGEEPFTVLTWNLADEADYGTGLVADNEGDFEALDSVSGSVINGAVLAAEFRWLVAPTSRLSADDLNASKNGDALPGSDGDVTVVQGANPAAVQQAQQVLATWEQRLGRTFLAAQSVQRQAERVTAEEIRLLAQELESSFGGVYTRLAAELQKPIAYWALEQADFKLKGTDIEITVITGLDALSRTGDLDRLAQALDLLGKVTALPEGLQIRINFQSIATFIGAGLGIDLTPFIKDEAVVQQELQQQAAARAAEATVTAGGEAAAQQGAQPQ